jgi:iron complex transport system substrate-binding protein
MKRVLAILLALMMVMTAFTGCATKAEDAEPATPEENEIEEGTGNEKPDEAEANDIMFPDFVLENTDESVTYLDPKGDATMISKNPETVVVLMNSILDMWYMAGGQAVGRVSGSTNVPEEAKEITDLGKITSLNMEMLVGLDPDLVIVSSTYSASEDVKKFADENGIECALIDSSIEPYKSFEKILYLFSLVNGSEEKFMTDIEKIVVDCDAIIEKANEVDDKPSAAILFTSTKSIKLNSDITLTGDMFKLMGGENIAMDAVEAGAKYVDYSFEVMLQKDPDFILITTMGDAEACKANFQEKVATQDAWADLTAVKEGNVHYMPKDLFMYKPNARYAEAFDYLAKIIYPGVFE